MLLNDFSMSAEVADVTLEVRCSGFYIRTRFTLKLSNRLWVITKVRLIEIT